MRKLAVATLLGAALTVGACGEDEEAAGGGGQANAAEQRTMTLIAGVKGDEFYISMNCGAQEAARKANVKLDFQGPEQFDPSLQTPVVNAVTAKKPDAILVAPTDTKAMFAPIKQAADNGSKVVLVDTTLEQPDLAASAIASDNLEGGREAARALIEQIGGTGKVLVVNVKPGISTTDARQKGFEEVVEAADGIEYLGAEFNNDDPAKAASIVRATLAKDPDLKGIFATNLFGAEGSATGLREAGKDGDVKIVGFDAGPKQVKDLQDGTVQALVVQKPLEIGRLGVEQALAALDGKPTKKEIGTGFVIATQENLTSPEVEPFLYKSKC